MFGSKAKDSGPCLEEEGNKNVGRKLLAKAILVIRDRTRGFKSCPNLNVGDIFHKFKMKGD